MLVDSVQQGTRNNSADRERHRDYVGVGVLWNGDRRTFTLFVVVFCAFFVCVCALLFSGRRACIFQRSERVLSL